MPLRIDGKDNGTITTDSFGRGRGVVTAITQLSDPALGLLLDHERVQLLHSVDEERRGKAAVRMVHSK